MIYLKTYLRDNSEAFMSCRTENLSNLTSKSLTDRELPTNLDASSLNTTGNRKTNIDTSDLVEPENGPAAKPARHESSVPGPAEIIDST